jgi:hypothetical protein
MTERASASTSARLEQESPRSHAGASGRLSFRSYVLTTRPHYLLGLPVIYSMAFPLMLLDLSATVYQHICFRIYGIARVRRFAYLVIDHHRLPYLNPIEKVHCVYCSYANQVIAYAREIIARSEQFFCPIKHARPILDPHPRTARFVAYADGQAYSRKLPTLRQDLEP